MTLVGRVPSFNNAQINNLGGLLPELWDRIFGLYLNAEDLRSTVSVSQAWRLLTLHVAKVRCYSSVDDLMSLTESIFPLRFRKSHLNRDVTNLIQIRANLRFSLEVVLNVLKEANRDQKSLLEEAFSKKRITIPFYDYRSLLRTYILLDLDVKRNVTPYMFRQHIYMQYENIGFYKALESAKLIDCPYERSVALKEFSDRMAKKGNISLALGVIELIPPQSSKRGEALPDLILKMVDLGEDLERAFQLSLSIDSPWKRYSLLQNVSLKMIDKGQWKRASEVVSFITFDCWKVEPLFKISIKTAESGKLRKAKEIAASIPDRAKKSKALALIQEKEALRALKRTAIS